jgi:hypothetical protein
MIFSGVIMFFRQDKKRVAGGEKTDEVDYFYRN